MNDLRIQYLVCITVMMAALAFLTMSCVSSAERRTMLHAEEIMEDNPDSALRLLKSIPAGSLSEEGDRAKYNLLFCQANVKLYNYDTEIDSIRQAVSYFEGDGDVVDEMKSRFYLGELYFMRDSLAQAMRNVLTANDISRTLEDDYWHAKTSEKIGDLYMSSLNPGQALRYVEEGAVYYHKADKQRNHRFALADLSYCLASLGKYHRSKSIADSIYNIALQCRDIALVEYCLDKMVFLNMLTGDYEEGISRYNQLAAMYGEENIPLETKMNKALLDTYVNPSDSLFARIRQITDLCVNFRQRAKIGYVENQYLEKFGTPDAQSVARQNLILVQDSLLLEEVSNSVNIVQRDHYSGIAAEQSRKRQTIMWVSTVAVMVLCLSGFAIFLCIRRKNKIKERRQLRSIEGLQSKLYNKDADNKMLQRSLSEQKKVINDLKIMISEAGKVASRPSSAVHDRVKVFQEKWKLFSEIYDSQFRHIDSTETSSQLLATYNDFLVKLRKPVFMKELRASVDVYMDGIITKLQEQCPWISAENIDILTMTYAGLSPQAIAYIMGMPLKTVANRRSRTLQKIEEMNPRDASLFFIIRRQKSKEK